MSSTVVPGSALVTGATGIVGWSTVQALHAQGHNVRVLARNVERTRSVVPPGVDVRAGDLADRASLQRAPAGCDWVFHAAGMPEQWLRDPGGFHRVNVEGTRTLVDAASHQSVGALVYTSTIDVFTHRPGVGYDESSLERRPLPTPYERSKQLADQVVAKAVSAGLPARFIHPAAVFGAAPTRTPGLNDVIAALAANRLPVLPPGGVPVVFVPDVARGQLSAATAPVGSRYILCDRYVAFDEMAAAISRIAGSRCPPQLPTALARAVAHTTEVLSRVTRRPPILPAGQLHFMTAHHLPDAARAAAELNWSSTPLEHALVETLRHLKKPSTNPYATARHGDSQ